MGLARGIGVGGGDWLVRIEGERVKGGFGNMSPEPYTSHHQRESLNLASPSLSIYLSLWSLSLSLSFPLSWSVLLLLSPE